ncbi:uncharacterized protein LOC114515608 isoform X2 [Dendronephthya gigantea]|uniref:uncharacterized protein LOC114515608 isoform X2 n=1 Tax=Dendronephthya gigantea TaxID=151771 RepID=UPI00106D985A|nr:uncharacterized protein LOC114515608 isoform X2 [Dendronephthya gigantea]
MRVDFKILVLAFIAIYLIVDTDAWFGSRRSSGRSSSGRSSSGRSSSRSSSIRRSRGWSSRTHSRSSSRSSPRRSFWGGGRRLSSTRSSSRRSGGWPSRTHSRSSSRSSSRRRFWGGVRRLGSIRSPSSNKKSIPHDIKTKSGLTKLFNKKVVSVQPVEQPLGALNNGKIGKGFVKLANKMGIKTSISGQKSRATHSGVVVTTSDKKKYLVHKGKKFGKSSQTVVVDAKHMSKSWENVGKSVSGNGNNVGSFVKAGGADYNLWGKNCHDATKDMTKLGKRKKRSMCISG